MAQVDPVTNRVLVICCEVVAAVDCSGQVCQVRTVNGILVRRLGSDDRTVAREMFAMMVDVFDEGTGDEDGAPVTDDHLDQLLSKESFWALAAFAGSEIIGGLTAHTLPMTRSATSEVFIYDLAVRQDHQRQGVGSRLIRDIRARAAEAGIREIFVPADNDDTHALNFYRAQGADEMPVTFFSFTAP